MCTCCAQKKHLQLLYAPPPVNFEALVKFLGYQALSEGWQLHTMCVCMYAAK